MPGKACGLQHLYLLRRMAVLSAEEEGSVADGESTLDQGGIEDGR